MEAIIQTRPANPVDCGSLAVDRAPPGLGILSWKGYTTLRHMLESLKADGFDELFDERVIFFPEIDSEARSIADEFGFRCEGAPANLGIYGGFKALAETLQSDTVLLLENDIHLIEPFAEARRQIEEAQRLVENETVQVVHLRNRADPGETFAGIAKYRRYHPPENASWSERISAFCLRTMRPAKAQRLITNAPYCEPHPEKKFSEIRLDEQSGFLLMDSQYRGWTNQSFMINRRFFLDVILRKVEETPSRRLINGFKNIEIEMNTNWWRNQPWTVAIAPGLFTHRRFGDRGY